jgi:hypothetical protein
MEEEKEVQDTEIDRGKRKERLREVKLKYISTFDDGATSKHDNGNKIGQHLIEKT